MRIVQVSAALILVLLAALLIGGAIIYANSSPFREGSCAKSNRPAVRRSKSSSSG